MLSPHSTDAPCGLRRRRPRERRGPRGKDGPLSRGRMENALQHYKAVTLRELQSSNVVDPGLVRHTRDTNATTLPHHCTRLSNERHRMEAHMRSLTIVSLLLASTAGAMSAEIKATS